MLGYKERGNPLGEELPAVEGEHAAEEGALLGPRSGLLLLPQDRQVEVVGRATLFLTACNMLTSRILYRFRAGEKRVLLSVLRIRIRDPVPF
jgi:hypothetical protein